MKLIVGLGNPGPEYTNTRHNLGFLVANNLVEQCNTSFATEKKLKAELAMFVRGDQTLIIAKPQTFMNLSGDCVRRIMDYYKISLEDVWVVSDDLDLEFGVIRVRVGGSSGGHNGLGDIIEKAGEGFVRFRMGIKNNLLERVGAEKFVLQQFDQAEADKVEGLVGKTAQLILDGLDNGVEHASHQVDGE